MKNKKVILNIALLLAIILIMSALSVGIIKLYLATYIDKDYQKLGLEINEDDILYYTVYHKDILIEYKVYKISEHINEIKEQLEKSDVWSKNKFYEYIMEMFYERMGEEYIDIDREDLYYYNQNETYAIIDLKNSKLYYYKDKANHHKEFYEILEVKTRDYENREIYSISGGMQYDGTDYYVYEFSEKKGKDIESIIRHSQNWSKDKLDDEIISCFKYNSEISSIKNGYYHYKKICRTLDEYKRDHFTDEEATGYEVGIYDADKYIFYYYWTSI